MFGSGSCMQCIERDKHQYAGQNPLSSGCNVSVVTTLNKNPHLLYLSACFQICLKPCTFLFHSYLPSYCRNAAGNQPNADHINQKKLLC